MWVRWWRGRQGNHFLDIRTQPRPTYLSVREYAPKTKPPLADSCSPTKSLIMLVLVIITVVEPTPWVRPMFVGGVCMS